MEGAFEAMGTGEVDLNWAKQHHKLWVEREMVKGRGAGAPSGAAATPAE
jgi:formate dehydrogenase subunit gamma